MMHCGCGIVPRYKEAKVRGMGQWKNLGRSYDGEG